MVEGIESNEKRKQRSEQFKDQSNTNPTPINEAWTKKDDGYSSTVKGDRDPMDDFQWNTERMNAATSDTGGLQETVINRADREQFNTKRSQEKREREKIDDDYSLKDGTSNLPQNKYIS
jgi:hypothetical protein